MPEIDITHIPFSRYGAYVAVTRDKIPGGTEYAKVLTIHTVRRRFEEGALFTLSFGAEEPEDFEVSAVPEAITVSNEHGKARIYIRDDNTVTVDSRGLDLCIRLRSFGYGTEMAEGSFRMIAPHLSLIATVAAPMGEAFTDGPVQGQKWGERDYKTAVRVRCKDGAAQLALMIRPCEPGKITLPLCPEEEIAQIRAEWEEFLAFMPDLPAADAETENFNLVTWYNLFSSFVRAEGDYKNDTMLMSKKTMSSTWSWDHCFNALAMAEMKTLESDPDRRARVALGQFSAPFYLQTPLGGLPDMWNPGLETRWGTMKPPIHGWCFEKLMDRFWIDRDTLTEIYFWLEKWTNWWMKECDTDGDGIPDYPQGCDSGWDTSTLFDIGYYLESPDLPAFLILQMRALAHLADKLTAWPVVTGKPWEARRDEWLAEADALLERFLAHSWNWGTVRRQPQRLPPIRRGAHEPSVPHAPCARRPLAEGDPGQARRRSRARFSDRERLRDGNARKPEIRIRRVLARSDLGALHLPAGGRPASGRVSRACRKGRAAVHRNVLPKGEGQL